MNIPELYTLFQKHPIITTDTRNCPSNSIFFALKGANFNGNKFASKAIAQGSRYAIVDEKEYANGKNIIYVEDSLKTLQQLASHHRKTLGTKIIGITGTNGKTTTKELLAAVLTQQYNILYTQGNLNNHIGVPLTLLQLTPQHEIGVIEMGASHPGDIKELVEITHPDYGIITNIGKAHLEGFGSFEGVIRTKGELYDYLRKNENSTIFLNADDPILTRISKGLSTIEYGASLNKYISGRLLPSTPYLNIEWKAKSEKDFTQINTQLIGEYNLDNLLAAITIGHFFNVSNDNIKKGLEQYIPNNNRSQLKKTAHNTLIIDAYNANPTSMQAALNNFSKLEGDNKTVILGDMKELGSASQYEHNRIINLLQQLNFPKVYLVGEEFNNCTRPSFISFPTVEALIEYIIQNPIKNQTILIKGSNSINLEKVIQHL